MKKKLKKLLTIGLATVMTLSFSMLAFAYSENNGSDSLGEGTMWYHIHVDGTNAYAGVSTNVTSDLFVDGDAHYFSVWDSYDHVTYLYGGAEQTTDYGVSASRDGSQMYYAEATFRASSNDGGNNAPFINCVD